MTTLTKESKLDRELALLTRCKRKLEAIMALRNEVIGLELQVMPGIRSDHADVLKVIVEEVCAHYRVTMDVLLSRIRTEAVSKPRQIVFFLGRQRKINCAQIGNFFNRNHETVLRGVQSLSDCMETNPDLAQTVETVSQRCRKRIEALETRNVSDCAGGNSAITTFGK